MFLPFAVAAIVAVTPPPPKLASPGLTGVQITPELANFYSNHLAQRLSIEGLSVMTSGEIASLLGLERQKQLAGCSEEGSCMIELANALGVDGLITGSIGKFGGLIQINLKVIASSDGRKLAIHSGTAESDEQVLGALKRAASSISEQVHNSMGIPLVKQRGGIRAYWWAPTAGAGVAAGLGIAMFAMASAQARALRGVDGVSSLNETEAQQALQAGITQRTIGITAFIIAGAAALTTTAFLIFGGPVSLSPMSDGAGGGLVLAGSWP